jgi:hypothetical protein
VVAATFACCRTACRAGCCVRCNARDGEAAIFYFHPWEIDEDQPRVDGINSRTRFRHYVNIHRMEGRIRQLLRDFKWGRMDHIFLDREASGVAVV